MPVCMLLVCSGTVLNMSYLSERKFTDAFEEGVANSLRVLATREGLEDHVYASARCYQSATVKEEQHTVNRGGFLSAPVRAARLHANRGGLPRALKKEQPDSSRMPPAIKSGEL